MTDSSAKLTLMGMGIARVFVVCAVLLAGQHALAAGTAAGTVIENTATADFDRAGIAESVTSNTITLRSSL